MTDEAKVSVDCLFNGPFTPQWMQQQRQAEQEELNAWKKLIKDRADLQWKLAAQKSHQAIMKNCRGVWRGV